MAQIKFDIPDEHLQDMINGTSRYYGYQAEIDGEPNPESKNVFAKRKAAANMRRVAIKGLIMIANDSQTEPDISIEPA